MKTKVNGISMVYEDLGNGPAIIVMHRRALDFRKEMRPIRALVRAGFRVVVLESPDMRSEFMPSADENAGALAGFLDYLGIGRAVFFADSANQEQLESLITNFPGRVAGYDPAQSGYSCDLLEHRLHHFLSLIRSKPFVVGVDNNRPEYSKFFSRASRIQ